MLCLFCGNSWHNNNVKSTSNLSTVFTARRVCIAQTMSWQDVCPSRPVARGCPGTPPRNPWLVLLTHCVQLWMWAQCQCAKKVAYMEQGNHGPKQTWLSGTDTQTLQIQCGLRWGCGRLCKETCTKNGTWVFAVTYWLSTYWLCSLHGRLEQYY